MVMMGKANVLVLKPEVGKSFEIEKELNSKKYGIYCH
jgi:hypothetical protein